MLLLRGKAESDSGQSWSDHCTFLPSETMKEGKERKLLLNISQLNPRSHFYPSFISEPSFSYAFQISIPNVSLGA
jgi:hypothetical protein